MFSQAIQKARNAVRDRSSIVHPTHWQAIDVSKMPEAATHEVLNYTLQAQVTTEDIGALARDIGPNLPWADDHFLERVGGEPLNPGVQWAKWPWGNVADKSRNVPGGPMLPLVDWAYLAGLVDGEGTIYLRPKDRGFSGRVIVYQKDRMILDYLCSTFRVGMVKQQDGGDKELNGTTYSNEMHLWQVNRIEEVKWLLSNLIPLLRIKKTKAEEMYKAALDWQEVKGDSGTPRQEVWGKKWEDRFSHSYMERMWPKILDAGSPMQGIRYEYGDASDVVQQLAAQPLTRQAFLPIWFPEDTGKTSVRVPCTLGYHFIMRHGYLHVTYYIRSCDIYRHFTDDIYLTVRLLLWILDELRGLTSIDGSADWGAVKPGLFTMHIVSLHCFRNDYIKMFGAKP